MRAFFFFFFFFFFCCRAAFCLEHLIILNLNVTADFVSLFCRIHGFELGSSVFFYTQLDICLTKVKFVIEFSGYIDSEW
jgi:hypothetical protein